MSTSTETGLGGGAAADPYAAYLVYDTFTDANDTSLDAHTPEKDAVGGGWVENRGNFDIQSNEANDAAGDANTHAYMVTSASNVRVAVELVQVQAGHKVGIVTRQKASENGDDYFWSGMIKGNAGGTDTYWIELTPSMVVRVSADLDIWTTGTRYYLATEADGQTLTLYVDDSSPATTERLEHTGAASLETETYHGIYVDTDAGTRFDNFQVTAL